MTSTEIKTEASNKAALFNDMKINSEYNGGSRYSKDVV